jgi:small-conductance mechanosensitive channel
MFPGLFTTAPSGGSTSGLQKLLAVDDMQSAAGEYLTWVQENILTIDVGIQAALLLAALVPALLFAPKLRRLITSQVETRFKSVTLLRRIARALAILATGIALYLTLSIFFVALKSAGRPADVISAAISLLTAWIIIRMVTLVIRSEFWSRVAFYIAWPIAALDAFGALDNVISQLQSLSIPLGSKEDQKISLFDILRTLLYFAVLFTGASALGNLLKSQIEKVDELTPSLKALIVKIMNVALPIVALLIALQLVGFNLATLTVFGGAIGLGIGLGLRGAVANFVAGFTLITDKSIKPGDVIGVGNTFGWVTSLEARYVSIRTRDGTEHLIPNETFMTDGVVNWSKSDKVVRIHAPFGVAYDTLDLRKVQSLAKEAALSVARVVKTPAPASNIMELGDNSVNFDLRFWISDPANGVSNVRSEVFLALWDLLHEHNIGIPFPQRDLHIKSWPETALPADKRASA